MCSLLFNIGFFAGAIAWARHSPRSLLRALVGFMTLLTVVMTVQIAMGWIRWTTQEPGQYAEVHRWTGHGLVIVAWLLMLAGIASSIVFGLRHQAGLAWLSGLGTSLMYGICLWTSFTGYLMPHEDLRPKHPEIFEETQNRFLVLHGCVFPAVTLLILCGCVWFCLLQLRHIRQASDRETDELSQSSGSLTSTNNVAPTSDDPNPYKAPAA